MSLLPLLLKLIASWKAKGEALSPRKKKWMNRVMGKCQQVHSALAEMGCTPDMGDDVIADDGEEA